MCFVHLVSPSGILQELHYVCLCFVSRLISIIYENFNSIYEIFFRDGWCCFNVNVVLCNLLLFPKVFVQPPALHSPMPHCPGHNSNKPTCPPHVTLHATQPTREEPARSPAIRPRRRPIHTTDTQPQTSDTRNPCFNFLSIYKRPIFIIILYQYITMLIYIVCFMQCAVCRPYISN